VGEIGYLYIFVLYLSPYTHRVKVALIVGGNETWVISPPKSDTFGFREITGLPDITEVIPYVQIAP
jgi:hypothetical protein